MSAVPDVIDQLAGIIPGSRLDAIRAQRPHARENAQNSYRALFEPRERGGLSGTERFALAAFVAGLHGQPRIHAFYADALAAEEGILRSLEAEIAAGRTEGPYGAYPPGPLSSEDRPGLQYRVSPASRAALGPRLSAALDHAHLLVFRPRDASPGDQQALLDASFTTTEIVTLSQLVAFLSFQIRVVAGLAVLAETGGA